MHTCTLHQLQAVPAGEHCRSHLLAYAYSISMPRRDCPCTGLPTRQDGGWTGVSLQPRDAANRVQKLWTAAFTSRVPASCTATEVQSWRGGLALVQLDADGKLLEAANT